MAKLILSLDGMVLREVSLDKERTTIGRKPHNDIHIDNLAVSGEHAVIVKIANDCFLEDLGSTNGTLINGKPVKKQFLQNNDVIELGKYKLKYFGTGPTSSASSEDYEQTMVWRPATMKAPGAEAPAGQAAAASSPADESTSFGPAPSTRAATQGATTAPASPVTRTEPPKPPPPAAPRPAPPPTAATPSHPAPHAPASAAPRPSTPPPAHPAAAAAPKPTPAPVAPPVAQPAVVSAEPPRPTVSPLWKTILIVAVLAIIAIAVFRIRG